jgi:hypothetical protein
VYGWRGKAHSHNNSKNSKIASVDLYRFGCEWVVVCVRVCCRCEEKEKASTAFRRGSPLTERATANKRECYRWGISPLLHLPTVSVAMW